MTETIARLEERLRCAERALADLDGRVGLLEGAALRVGEPAPAVAATDAVVHGGADLVGTLTLIGRTFVILAGAYLLRALTESDVLDRSTGATLGLAYAAAWTAVAWHVGRRHPLSATFLGACTVVIGFPLLWEATTRFALVSSSGSALALAAIAAVVLATAWRKDLPALAWIATLGTCALACVLFVKTGGAAAFTVVLIALGVATLWLGYDREWTALRWVAAPFADLAVVALAVRALATPPREAPWLVMQVQLLLLVGYLGSIAVRTLVRGRDVLPFEVVQSGMILLSGLGGAMLVARQTGGGAAALGSALVVLAVACYGVAFAFVDRRQGRGENFYFYSSLALVFALTGCGLVAGGPALGVVWAALAVLAGWAGRRYGRGTLGAHAVMYVTAAAVPSGLVSSALAGLLGPAATCWAPVGAAAWAVLAAMGLCWVLSTPGSGRVVDAGPARARVTLALVTALGAAGACVVVVCPALPSPDGTPLHLGLVATLRTGILALAAVGLAWLGRRARLREFGLLLYPALAWGGLKLMVEDVPTSPPALLVVAFALYGGALILGPRIARRPDAMAPMVDARTPSVRRQP